MCNHIYSCRQTGTTENITLSQAVVDGNNSIVSRKYIKYIKFNTENTETNISIIVCTPVSSWDPPTGWTGPESVVYRSFNCPYGLNMMEGTEQADFPLVQGQVYILNLWNL